MPATPVPPAGAAATTTPSRPRRRTAEPTLTPRQQQVLELVRRAIERSGAPPTRAEIAAALGFRSPNAAEEHLQALARKGAIELVGGTSRGIRLAASTLRKLRKSRAAARGGDTPWTAAPGSAPLTLPLVGRVAAGSPILAAEHLEGSYAIDESLFARRPDYLLRVRGMSMRDAGILDGDLLAVQKAHEAREGQIVVARIGDEVTVKRFRRKAQHVELQPENPEYRTIVVGPGETDFALEGIAVGLIRNPLQL